jgi:hypothetical protein
MRTIAITLILVISAGFAFAQTTPEDYTKTFFDLVGQKKYTEAIEKMPVNKRLENDSSFTTKLLGKLEMAGNKAGEYCGYELIQKEEISPSFVMYTYFIKYYNFPQKIQFTFYKPKDEWLVTQINPLIQNNPTTAGAGNRKQGMKKP